MVYKLYSRKPGQEKFYITCPRTLAQKRAGDTVLAFLTLEEAEKACKQATSSCISSQIEFKVKL